MLIDGGNTAPRPLVKSIQGCDDRLLSLLSKCWLENPSNRPTVSELKKDIFAATKSLYTYRNFFDFLIETNSVHVQRKKFNGSPDVDVRKIYFESRKNRR